MNRKKIELGCIAGLHYMLIFDKYKFQQGCDYSIENKWAWFLTIGEDCVGSFNTKKEALSYLALC